MQVPRSEPPRPGESCFSTLLPAGGAARRWRGRAVRGGAGQSKAACSAAGSAGAVRREPPRVLPRAGCSPRSRPRTVRVRCGAARRTPTLARIGRTPVQLQVAHQGRRGCCCGAAHAERGGAWSGAEIGCFLLSAQEGGSAGPEQLRRRSAQAAVNHPPSHISCQRCIAMQGRWQSPSAQNAAGHRG